MFRFLFKTAAVGTVVVAAASTSKAFRDAASEAYEDKNPPRELKSKSNACAAELQKEGYGNYTPTFYPHAFTATAEREPQRAYMFGQTLSVLFNDKDRREKCWTGVVTLPGDLSIQARNEQRKLRVFVADKDNHPIVNAEVRKPAMFRK